MSGWLPALRMARREARRAKGRSALVLALIGLPVVGLTVAAVSYDMVDLTPAERLERQLGTADAELRWVVQAPLTQRDATGDWVDYPDDLPDEAWQPPAVDAAAITAMLPAGSRVTPRWIGEHLRLPTATGVGGLDWLALDLADPLTEGTGYVIDGRAPAGPGEVALTATAATRLAKGIGDQVEIPDHGTVQVVGLLEFPGIFETGPGNWAVPQLRHQLLVFHPDGRPDDGWQVRWLATTPAPVTWEQVRELNQHGILVHSRAVALDPPPELTPQGPVVDAPVFAAGVLVAGLAVLQIVLLAGPAFAVGARRRQRDLALVAAGGGTPAQLRRIVLADGVVLGGLAGLLGVGLGIAAAFAGRPLVETVLVGARAGGYRVFPEALAAIATLAVVTAILAALVPAFTAARLKVVEALAGRRGVTRSRRRWLVVGLVLAGLGTVVTAYGAWESSAQLALAGLIMGQLGLALCTPALVGLVARLGSRLPLPPRIALRDTSRNRAAAAPAITAVMAAVAGGVGASVIAVAIGSTEFRGGDWRPPGTAVVWYEKYEYIGDTVVVTPGLVYGAAEVRELPRVAAVEQAARSTLPVTAMHQQWSMNCPLEELADDRGCFGPSVIVPAERICPYWDRVGELPPAEQRQARADPRCAGDYQPYGSVRVDDGDALAVLADADPDALASARQVLRDGGAVVGDPRFLDEAGQVHLGEVDYRRWGEPEMLPDQTTTVPGFVLPGMFRQAGAIVGPELAASFGMEVGNDGDLIFLTSRMPTEAEQDAFSAALANLELDGHVVPAPRSERASPYLLILAAVAALVALGAAAIATGLAAADRRADLSTLAAVGASPRVRRSLSLSQSGVIAGLGTVLGLLAGLGVSTAVLVALNRRNAGFWPAPPEYPIVVPWTVLVALLAVPLVAMLGAGLLTRSRLPIERRLT